MTQLFTKLQAAARAVIYPPDPAVRHGIKYGIAGVCAFCVSITLRLDTPVWSVVSVFVLMLAQYVGAIAEKSIFRVVGTIAGGIVGYLLTASLQQDPLVYLPLVGAMVAFGVVFFGQQRMPYVFLLFGLTIAVVASNGMLDPDLSWKVALARTEEVIVGVIVSLVVTSVLWPRYARLEFPQKIRAELALMASEYRARAGVFLRPGELKAVPATGAGRLLAVRNLLHFGARESSAFRRRLPSYNAVVEKLAEVAATIADLGDVRTLDPIYHECLLTQLTELEASTASLLDQLASGEPAYEALTRAAQARASLDAALASMAVRLNTPRTVSTDHGLALGSWISSTLEIQRLLEAAHAILVTLPDASSRGIPEPHPTSNPPLDPAWIHTGVRSGIAVILGLVVQNWLHPPGGGIVTLSAFVFTALSRLYPGGEGDRRAFHYCAQTAFFGLFYVLAMLLLAPLMASYAVLNILLFTALFLFGWLSYAIPGISFGMQIMLLATVGTLGLNAQQPVHFQAIAGVYFGVVTGLLISSLVQRFLWPVLPQFQLRDRLAEWLGYCHNLSRGKECSVPAWCGVRLALLPAETSAWIAVMNKPDTPPGEQDRLRAVTVLLSRIANHLSKSQKPLPESLSPEALTRITTARSTLLASVAAALSALESRVSAGTPPPQHLKHDLSQLIEKWKASAQETREWMYDNIEGMTDKYCIFGSLGHTLSAAVETLALLEAFEHLALDRYFIDSIL